MSRLGSLRGFGCVDFEVGVKLKVNGKRGKAWTMVIAYEPDDTYTDGARLSPGCLLRHVAIRD